MQGWLLSLTRVPAGSWEGASCFSTQPTVTAGSQEGCVLLPVFQLSPHQLSESSIYQCMTQTQTNYIHISGSHWAIISFWSCSLYFSRQFKCWEPATLFEEPVTQIHTANGCFVWQIEDTHIQWQACRWLWAAECMFTHPYEWYNNMKLYCVMVNGCDGCSPFLQTGVGLNRHLLVVWPWVCYSTPLSSNLLFSKERIIMEPTSKAVWVGKCEPACVAQEILHLYH